MFNAERKYITRTTNTLLFEPPIPFLAAASVNCSSLDIFTAPSTHTFSSNDAQEL